MITYKPDRQGTGRVLRENCRDIVNEAARQIAGQVRSQEPDAEVAVNFYTTDRAAASVTIADPRGRLWAVRDGIFTRAAGSMGLQVRAR